MAFKTVAGNAPDAEALTLLGSVLSGGRTSRLYAVVVEPRIALNATAGGGAGRGPGLFSFSATVPPNGSVEAIEKAFDSEIDRLQADGVTEAELQKAKTQARARLLSGGGGGRFGGLQTALGRANALTQNAIFFDDPNRVNTQITRLEAVTLADIKRVAKHYLDKQNRVIVIDGPEPDAAPEFFVTPAHENPLRRPINMSIMHPFTRSKNQIGETNEGDGMNSFVFPPYDIGSSFVEAAERPTAKEFIPSRFHRANASIPSRSLGLGLLALAAALVSAPALSQDTPGTPTTSTSGAVIKGKAPVAKQLLRVKFPKPKTFTLKNGLTVYVLEDHRFPACRFSLSLRAGSLYEPKPGVAEFTAAMLTEGTTTRSFLELAAETENIGAALNANAGAAYTIVSASGLSESSDILLALMHDALLHPAFPTDRLDRLKFQQTSQLAQRRTNPQALIADLSAKVYYGGTPYNKPSATAEQISAITADDLKAFYTAYYRPNGALLGVTGDVDTKTLRGKLEMLFADWQPGAAEMAQLPAADFKPSEATKVYLIDRPGSAQTVLQFGNLAVQQSDPDYIPLVVANQILGGGSSGRLFQNIRERKGYTYGAYSALSASQWPGTWGASASVRTPVTQPAAAEFFAEFTRLQDEPVSASELARAKRSLIGSFARTLESPENVLSRTLDRIQNGLPADYWDTYPARVEAVTPAEVQRVARKYLGKGRIQLIAVGERSQIEEGLKGFGPIENVDASQLGGGRRGRGR